MTLVFDPQTIQNPKGLLLSLMTVKDIIFAHLVGEALEFYYGTLKIRGSIEFSISYAG